MRNATPLPLPLLLLPLSLVLAPTGCVSDVDDDEGAVAMDEIPFERRATIPARKGYLDGRPLAYLDFGSFVPADADWFPSFDEFPGMPVGEMYVFAADEGQLALAHQQYPIVDRLPKQARYSDFFELVAVHPPRGYAANTIKSRATLLRLGYRLERTGKVVNCPLVGPDAKLGVSRGEADAYPKISVWYRKQRARCFLIDGGDALLPEGVPSARSFATRLTDQRSELRVAAAEVYVMRSGAYAGEDRVSNILVPDSAIFRHGPGSPDYSPLARIWDVGVPSDYVVGQLASYAQLFPVPDFTDPRIEARSPAAFCNCPIIRVEEAQP